LCRRPGNGVTGLLERSNKAGALTVESFDLAAALENPASSPRLEPLDTIRIFSRYDFEPSPKVWVGVSYFIAKRIFDLVFSSLVLLLALPLLLAIAVAIKLTSAGPIFFTQERVGLKGQIFKMYKFRTMRIGSVADADATRAVPNDPRRTKIGAFLRHTGLDELPQFYNVLKGDMSVVGPRPEMLFFVRKFSAELARYNSRHYVKAGITGWAQANGLRGDTSIIERVQYDLYYLRHWSIGFDLQIILLTVFRGIVNKNAC
jgi:exopolysaccharide biosynthesis polyprenyl glycosylphosphotransferase